MTTAFDFALDADDPATAQRTLQARLADAHRMDEARAVHALLDEAQLSDAQLQQARTLAATLATQVRAERSTAGGIDALMLEFSLDSAAGIALMCLAEALLRIPDDATRDSLIRDKLRGRDWQAHIGTSPSLFVNAAAWGLLTTGTLLQWHSENALTQALATLLRKGGEPLIRKAVDVAMRMLGQQFVTGRDIAQALANASARAARGYTFSYDMLGEAALTMADAQRYYTAYETAIHAIGAAADGRGLIAGPGISIKLVTRDDGPLLIAETGGQNAMIVDSSALPEQVVADALLSAFDSAGQRCSALRVLCVQEDIADGVLHMLEGAMHELRTGDPRRLATDVGPVIDADATTTLNVHIARLRSLGLRVVQTVVTPECARGTFVPPTLIDLGDRHGLQHLEREVFGPVLHVLRWRQDELATLIDAINATGYALTHGVATRIDTTVTTILSRVHAGNVYVNRNMIGAVVGVQPFGGHGLSGTGPKAGGPLYLRRLMRHAPSSALVTLTLPGPTGETNSLEFLPRGVVACIADDEGELIAQGTAAHACGNTLMIERSQLSPRVRAALAAAQLIVVETFDPARIDAVLLSASPERTRALRVQVAALPGKIVPVIVADTPGAYDPARLVVERTVTVNTAAAGGDATLLSLAEDP